MALAALAICCSASQALGQTFFPAAGTSADGPPASIYLASTPAAAPPAGEQAWPPTSVESLPPTANEPGQSWIARQAAQQPADSLRPLSGSWLASRMSNWWSPPAVCDDCPRYGIQALVGYDSFRGIADDSWQNNGIHTGINFGTRLGPISDYLGIGAQVGGTVNIYDWSGTEYKPNATGAVTQGFLTYGIFRKPNATSKISAAFVQDWMFNNNYGVFSQNPTMSQGRYQLGYAVSARNEFGVWGTARFLSDTKNVAGLGPTTWRPIDQFNIYWHYKWAPGGADTQLWVGVPEDDRLGGSGSLGSWLVGASANVPLNDRVALYTLVTYLRPSAAPGPAASTEEFWNFTIGLTFYPQRNARSSTVAGQCWMPQLPIANNGYFLVDTNRH